MICHTGVARAMPHWSSTWYHALWNFLMYSAHELAAPIIIHYSSRCTPLKMTYEQILPVCYSATPHSFISVVFFLLWNINSPCRSTLVDLEKYTPSALLICPTVCSCSYLATITRKMVPIKKQVSSFAIFFSSYAAGLCTWTCTRDGRRGFFLCART